MDEIVDPDSELGMSDLDSIVGIVETVRPAEAASLEVDGFEDVDAPVCFVSKPSASLVAFFGAPKSGLIMEEGMELEEAGFVVPNAEN